MKSFQEYPHALDRDFDFLIITWIREHVVQVQLNRPQKRNAIHRRLWMEIGQVFSLLGRSGDGCRCILLVGSGTSFSAGLDVTDESLLPKSDPEQQDNQNHDVARIGLAFAAKIHDMQACFTALETCPVPVVAAVQGNCIGAGVDLICAATVRWCSPDAVFAVREVQLGLAADVGTLQRMPKLIGHHSWVYEICLTGRAVTADEALQKGLVSRVVDVDESGSSRLWEQAAELCEQMASHSPVAVQGTKRGLLYARDHSVADGLEQIASYNALALQSQDLPTAVMARMSKEKPNFSNFPAFSKL